MSPFVAGNLILLLSMLATASAQVLFKTVLNELGPESLLTLPTLKTIATTPWMAWRAAGGGLLVVLGFSCWILSLSRLDLSYAYPLASSSVLLVAFLSGFFLGEPVTLRVWAGTLLILLGIALLAPSNGAG